MLVQYIGYSISITFISWIVGLLVTAIIRKKSFFQEKLSNLNFIKSEPVNRIIGIGILKWLIKNTFIKIFNPNLKVKRNGGVDELVVLRHQMTVAEVGHLIGFVFVAVFALPLFYRADYLFALIMIIVNILMNLYPSLLQQQNKRRIDKLVSYKRTP